MEEIGSAQEVRQLRANATCIRRRMINGSQCAVCGFNVTSILHLHHRIPVAKGGDNRRSNVVLLCPNCHALVHEAARRAFIRSDIQGNTASLLHKRFLRFKNELISIYGEVITGEIFDLARDAR